MEPKKLRMQAETEQKPAITPKQLKLLKDLEPVGFTVLAKDYSQLTCGQAHKLIGYLVLKHGWLKPQVKGQHRHKFRVVKFFDPNVITPINSNE